MVTEPESKRAVAFFDGQNLYHAVRDAFGYTWPNYDPLALAHAVCGPPGWTLVGTRFYTGVPEPLDNPFWNGFWASKLLTLSRSGVDVFSRALRYRNRRVLAPDGTEHAILVGEEKGIDVRIALDVLRLTYRRELDVAIVFSQDQDLAEVAEEIRFVARDQGRWVKIVSAYPVSPTSRNRRGINRTDWVRIERATYDTCLDLLDHRPPRSTR